MGRVRLMAAVFRLDPVVLDGGDGQGFDGEARGGLVLGQDQEGLGAGDEGQSGDDGLDVLAHVLQVADGHVQQLVEAPRQVIAGHHVGRVLDLGLELDDGFGLVFNETQRDEALDVQP